MVTLGLDQVMTPLDLAAVAVFLATMLGYGMVCGIEGLERASLVGAIQRQRVAWMLNMARRDNRVLDAIVLGGLGQGNAFFASTTAIAIGGLTALLGSGEKAQAILERIPFVARSSTILWEM